MDDEYANVRECYCVDVIECVHAYVYVRAYVCVHSRVHVYVRCICSRVKLVHNVKTGRRYKMKFEDRTCVNDMFSVTKYII